MPMIPSFFFEKLSGLLLEYAQDKAVKLLRVPDEIKKLHINLQMISAVLLDAERKEIQDQSIKLWLNGLRDIMYDAEDIIEECNIEGQSSPSTSTARLITWFLAPFSCVRFRHEIGNEIDNLNHRLQDIIKRKDDFGLIPIPHGHQNSSSLSSKARWTTSTIEPRLVGTTIEKATNDLVEWLTQDHHQKPPIVAAILGMGGIGKTTLAQKIFNNDILQDFFPISAKKETDGSAIIPRVWVCVSRDFDEVKILTEIIRRMGGEPGDARDKEDLEPMLINLVKKQKIFLVLDDVWDACVWEDLLRKPLQIGCVHGSRILITTRKKDVAVRMEAIHYHWVDALSVDDCWSLLKNSVFQEEDEDKIQQLQDIGLQIAEKCDGLPVAVKAIAGVLKTKSMTRSEWGNVRRNPVWSSTDLHDEVTGALYLSYEDLPSHLRQCFTYFALFPEDSILRKDYFVHLWRSEGFIKPLESASEYWEELVQRSLLQPESGYYETEHCRMHDLVLSLARRVAGAECFCGYTQEFPNRRSSSSSTSSTYSSMKLRRLYLLDEEVNIMSDLIKQQASLRTLVFGGIQGALNEDFTALKCLRILDLSGSTLEELPISIKELICLRYLNLSSTEITEIPESIGTLKNLQVVNVERCTNLRHLPKSIVLLNTLEALLADKAMIDNMPLGMRKLQQLEEITGFIAQSAVGNEGLQSGSSTLEDLESLSQLSRLSISKLERVSSRDVARAAKVRTKPHLSHLVLSCTHDNPEVEALNMNKTKEVFEELCPPPSVTHLKIIGYFGLEFPSWMMVLSVTPIFPDLQRLELVDCRHFKQIPFLGQLPSLEYLSISGASGVTSIGPELFFGGDRSHLPFSSFLSLKSLHLKDMSNWEEWQWLEEKEGQPPMSVLPRLKAITIARCPKLMSLPDGLLNCATALAELEISEADSLREIKNLLSVKNLRITRTPNLETLSNLPSLKYLRVSKCGGLRNLRNLVCLDALQHLVLYEPLMNTMQSLPEWLITERGALHLSSVQRLDITGSTELFRNRHTLYLEKRLPITVQMRIGMPDVDDQKLEIEIRVALYVQKAALSFIDGVLAQTESKPS